MIAITPALLRAATGCTRDLADIYAERYDHWCRAFLISETPERLAPFLATLAHESGSLSRLWESLDYTPERLLSVFGAKRISPDLAHTLGRSPTNPADQPRIAEVVYGGEWGRKNLGNTEPGDAWNFRGCGHIQLTGRGNAKRATQALREIDLECPNFESDPEARALPEWVAALACWFWAAHGCNHLADNGDFGGVTRVVNGAAVGMEDRIKRLAVAQRAIGAQPIDTSAGSVDSAPADQHIEDTTMPSSMPAGDAPMPEPDPAPAPQPQPQEPRHMAPIITALLPSLVAAIPKLGALFGSGSEVAQRNVKAAEIAFAVAKDALSAPNEQAVIERVQADPQAAASVRQAVEAHWYAITEAGGGGIDGARKADLAQQSGGDIRKSASFWIALLLLPMPYMLVASLIGLIGTATWSDDVRAGLAGSLISAVIGGLVGYYYGQTTTRNRTAKE